MEAESVISDDFEVFHENWETVQLFLLLGTQWNVISMGGYSGLRYEAVEAVMSITQIPKRRRAELFHNLRIMEYAALDEMHKKVD